jgi:hypothetical protein
MNDLRQWSQAVGSARSIAEKLKLVTLFRAKEQPDDMIVRSAVLVLIHTHDEHRSIGTRSRDNDFFGTSLQMGSSLVHGSEAKCVFALINMFLNLHSSRFNHEISASFAPWNFGRILGIEDGDGVRTLAWERDEQLSVVSLDFALESTMSGIVLEHIDHLKRH